MPDVDDAIGVLQEFLAANDRMDDEGMRRCLSRNTLESGQFNGGMPGTFEYRFGDVRTDDGRVIVPMSVMSTDAGDVPVMSMDCVMVREEGGWKFDLEATVAPQMEAMEGIVGQMAAAMGQAMEGMVDALGSAFESAFGSDDVNWDDAPDRPTGHEVTGVPILTDLPQATRRISEALGFDVWVVADADGLVRGLDADAPTLSGWIDEQLTADWARVFEEANRLVPLRGRLRRIRIERAPREEDRFVAADGNEVLLRLCFDSPDGYYSDAELMELMPGVCAGLLDALDESMLGASEFPGEHDCPTMETYERFTAPRWMRRISERVGRPLRLDADWQNMAFDERCSAWIVPWGLNRVFGAIELVRNEDDGAEVLQGLRAIRVVPLFGVDDRWADFDGQTLSVGLDLARQERGCFYEHELARVLRGESVGLVGGVAPEEPASEATPEPGGAIEPNA